MLISLSRTAIQALTFNVNPALLPRWEIGPLVIAFGLAVLSGASGAAPLSAVLVLVMGLLLLALKTLLAMDTSRTVPGEMVALGYLMSAGILMFNVPAVLVSVLGLAYSGGPGVLLEATSAGQAGGFGLTTEYSAISQLLKELGGSTHATHVFAQDASDVLRPVALLFIVLSLASARPRIRRTFYRDDVRMARHLLMAAAAGIRAMSDHDVEQGRRAQP